MKVYIIMSESTPVTMAAWRAQIENYPILVMVQNRRRLYKIAPSNYKWYDSDLNEWYDVEPWNYREAVELCPDVEIDLKHFY